ncbi:MAG: tetratricopeptide repeat protein [Elusimicrobiota bacterium]
MIPAAGSDKDKEPVSAQPVKKMLSPADKKALMGQYFTAGQQEYKKGDYEKAAASWKKVLEIEPGHELSKKNIQRAEEKLKGK